VKKTLLSRHRLEIAAAALAAALLAPRPAIAQTERDLVKARQWFKEAEAAEKQKDCEGALVKYEQVLTIKETPQIHLRIGRCREMLGRLADGLASYQRALDQATAASLADVVSVAREQVGRLAARVPTLVITPAEPYEAFAATIDGKPVPAADYEKKQRLNPGSHTIAAHAQGYRPFELPLSLTEGEGRRLVITLVPTAPSRNGGEEDGSDDMASRAPAFVLIGGGAAAIGVGVALFAVSLGKDSDLDDACGGPERLLCPESRREELESLVSSVDTFRLVAGVLGGVGVIAASAGVVLLLSAPPSASASAEPASPRSAAPRDRFIRITPSFDGRSVGFGAVGRF
jgi:hypothetical protein